MLLVKTYIEKSALEGIGLFAGEWIRKGTVVCKPVPGFDKSYTQAEFDALPPQAQDFLQRYSYLKNGRYHFPADNDRFTNHSEDGNTTLAADGSFVALRDIEEGEEITVNYREILDAPEEALQETIYNCDKKCA